MSSNIHSLGSRSLKSAKLFPFWLDNDEASHVADRLTGDTEADLLLVGGGFTGLWAAIQAKEAQPGLDVVVIEAGKVAHGASGRPGGLVSTSLMHGLSNALRTFPADLEFLEELGHENMRDFRAALSRYDIDCDAAWNGELTVAIGEESLVALNEEFRLQTAHGHHAQLLDAAEVRAEIDSPLYDGAIWSRDNSGVVHPAKLAWGLKRAAISSGVRLYEMTPMIGIVDQASSVAVATEHGEVRAPKVLLCTNAFAAGDKRIKHRVTAIRDRVLATQPLTDEQLSRIGWRNRQGVMDTRTQLKYSQLTKDHRIIFGGRLDYFYGNNTDPESDRTSTAAFEPLADEFFRTFPQLDDVAFSHAWSGPIALTTRMAVHFQRYHNDKVVYAGGYSGFGISASRFGARVGLNVLDGKDFPESELGLVTTMPNRIPGEPLRWVGAKVTMHAVDTADEKGTWRNTWLKMMTAVGFPLS